MDIKNRKNWKVNDTYESTQIAIIDTRFPLAKYHDMIATNFTIALLFYDKTSYKC